MIVVLLSTIVIESCHVPLPRTIIEDCWLHNENDSVTQSQCCAMVPSC
jgi:hypothetical protein